MRGRVTTVLLVGLLMSGASSASALGASVHIEASQIKEETYNREYLVTVTGEGQDGENLWAGDADGASGGKGCTARPEEGGLGEFEYETPYLKSTGPFKYTFHFTAANGNYDVWLCAYLREAFTVEAKAEAVLTIPESIGEAEYRETKEAGEAAEKKSAEEQERKREEEKAREKREDEEYHRKQEEQIAAANARDRAACKAEYDRVWQEGKELRGEYQIEEGHEDAGLHCFEASEFKSEELAREKAEGEQHEREYNAAKAAARGKPLTHLSIKVVAHGTQSSARPGYTSLDIKAAPFATVTIKLSRHGHSAERYEFGTGAQEEIRKEWTCTHPGGVYHYTVIARSGVGPTLTRKGTFRPVSVARCDELKRHEQEVLERSRNHAEAEAERELAEKKPDAGASKRTAGRRTVRLAPSKRKAASTFDAWLLAGAF